jgi:parallel beta-helix repeat protein
MTHSRITSKPGRKPRCRRGLTAVLLVFGLVAAIILSVRLNGPSPFPRQPPAAATTTQPPQLSSACLTGGGVAIGARDDAQSVVNGHPPGTTYIVKAGIHLRNFSVRPKSGDTFCGEPGAALDGGRSLVSAFSGPATNVTLDSITVQEYESGWQGAAIHPDARAGGWVVRNVSALRNGWAGLLASDGMRILGGHYNDNDQMGIGGNATTGVVLDGLDDDSATLDGPELARNQSLRATCEFEGGGMKWDVGTVVIRNAYVHDNDCRGLWADINSHNALIEDNLIQGNRAEGILIEISRDALIRNNRIYRNGFRGKGWYWDGGITVASSSNVEVYGNRLSGNYNGITGTQQDRPDSTPPEHLLDNFQVNDNMICATGDGGHPTGVAAGNGADLATRNIRFTRNTIQSEACE